MKQASKFATDSVFPETAAGRGLERGPGRRAVLTLCAGALLGLAGCSGILPGQGAAGGALPPDPQEPLFRGGPAQVDWQLVLETPTSNAALNTTRVALQRDPMRIEYYARAGWVDLAPIMLQTLLLESFENSNSIVSVGRENIGLRSDFVLKTDLREFQAVYSGTGPPEVLVAMTVKLVQMPRRTIVGNAKFSHRTQASADSLDAVVDAFDVALGKALKRVVLWTLETGQQVES